MLNATDLPSLFLRRIAMTNRITPQFPKFLVTVCLVATFLAAQPFVRAQDKVQDKDRDRALSMLRRIKNELKKNYYDPKFHGMDLEARFKTAEDKIKTDTSVGQIFGTIAQVLIELEDSHTFFLPPSRAYTTDYGWTMQIVGDRCFVSTSTKAAMPKPEELSRVTKSSTPAAIKSIGPICGSFSTFTPRCVRSRTSARRCAVPAEKFANWICSQNGGTARESRI